MSDVEQNETIAQPATSEEQAPEQGQPIQANEEQLGIPQKFLGASTIDVIRSYQQLETERGRMANELGELRKSREESEERLKQLETARYTQPAQPVQQAQPQQELDPLSVLDSRFDEDPKAAIRAALEAQQQIAQQSIQQQRQQQEASKASEFYYQQKQTNPDFARREPVMQQLAQQYSHIIRPEFLNSADAIKVLDLMSRGHDIDYYKTAAVKDTQKQRASVVEEKRRSQSEGVNSQGDTDADFSKMSNSDYAKAMESLHGHAVKD